MTTSRALIAMVTLLVFVALTLTALDKFGVRWLRIDNDTGECWTVVNELDERGRKIYLVDRGQGRVAPCEMDLRRPRRR